MPRVLSFTAGPADEGRTVRDVIAHEFCLVAHDVARAKYDIENGITVDGASVYTDRVLRAGETLEVILPDEPPGKIVPAPGPLAILYEDDDVLAVSKEAGMVAHPSHGHFADTLANRVAAYYLESGSPHEVRMAGRLDKDTSGVMVFGKSRSACAALQGQTRNGDGAAVKCYLAACAGAVSPKEGVIDSPISREYEDRIRRVVRDDGASAVTSYKVVGERGDISLLAVSIETGRTHQIRVHFSHMGNALLGDPIYGDGEERSGMTRSALHAWRVSFRQPFTREELLIEAPLPPDMAGLFDADALEAAAAYFADITGRCAAE